MPSLMWDDLSMDSIRGLPPSKGVDTFLVVVDRLSKYAHFLTLRHPFTALTVAELFVKEVVRLHGFPTSIVSDRDRIFMSIFFAFIGQTLRGALLIIIKRMVNLRSSARE